MILLLALAFAFFYSRAARLAAANFKEARTDSLTGLPNRRALVEKLEADLPRAGSDRQVALALFDLDGFKQYNDTFGHPAGDALLTRLGERLATALDGIGRAYRMGGDEFCILAPVEPAERRRRGRARRRGALGARRRLRHRLLVRVGAGAVGGRPRPPTRCASPTSACTRRRRGRSSASRQSTDVLLKVLSERSIELREHLSGVADWPRQTAARLGLPRTRSS